MLKKHQSTVTHTWVEGALFKDGIAPTDAVQGSPADCYLVSSLAAIARAQPQAIRDAIRDNGDGTYTVRFYETPWFGGRREVHVTVDGQLPTKNGKLMYGSGGDQTELWMPVIEKAFAKWKGGYEAIGNGGSADSVLNAVLGRRTNYVALRPGMDTERLYADLQRSLQSGSAVVAATRGDRKAQTGEKPDALFTNTGLTPWHAYTVLGVSEENGQKYVELRNPWGENEPSGNGPDDGVFRLTVQDFAKYYAAAWVN